MLRSGGLCGQLSCGGRCLSECLGQGPSEGSSGRCGPLLGMAMSLSPGVGDSVPAQPASVVPRPVVASSAVGSLGGQAPQVERQWEAW